MNALSRPIQAANQNAALTPRAGEAKAFSIKGLKAEVARLERLGAVATGAIARSRLHDQMVRLGVPEVDTHLPWGGLPCGALHELAGEGADREQAAAAAGFAALWLARLQAAGPVLWIARAPGRAAIDLHAHGLKQLALDPQRLILVAARRDDEALWAMEEGLKAKGLGAVLGEIGRLDLTASRRLQLAAEASGVTAFVLRRWRLMTTAEREAARPIAAMTRWRIASIPGEGACHWQVALTRCRGGKPAAWTLEQADGPENLHAAPLSGDLAEVMVGRSLVADAAQRAHRTERRAG
ncbi:MAG TPA: hypothetical protein VMT54_05930 [Candidatus Cybelea sp.]|nr:hypothetical protein [Candidatus Cybelea sp.]